MRLVPRVRLSEQHEPEENLMRSPESYEKSELKLFLGSFGKDCWHFSPFMKGFGKNGVPDIVACYKGQFFSIEVKREGAKPTPIQLRRMKEITDAGGHTFCGTADVVKSAIRTWLNLSYGL